MKPQFERHRRLGFPFNRAHLEGKKTTQKGPGIARVACLTSVFNSDQTSEQNVKIPAGTSFANRGPNWHIYGGKMTCLNNKESDMMVAVAGQETLGLGGRLGSVSDRFGPAAATKLRPVALQSKGPNQSK
jgi:hypothetical protein